ncbi:MAG: hypothetical protein BMS9Abin05_0605 [Rhodothermia bacterium]|nr:MAG: hypothetical protein BMS9Abin05_0605 [Rhodothermia bacterium]
MAKPRLSVQKIREILRLRFEFGLFERKIAVSCHIARSTVSDYLRRAAEAGVRPSIGCVGDCFDDAMAESFFATLETELLDSGLTP